MNIKKQEKKNIKIVLLIILFFGVLVMANGMGRSDELYRSKVKYKNDKIYIKKMLPRDAYISMPDSFLPEKMRGIMLGIAWKEVPKELKLRFMYNEQEKRYVANTDFVIMKVGLSNNQSGYIVKVDIDFLDTGANQKQGGVKTMHKEIFQKDSEGKYVFFGKHDRVSSSFQKTLKGERFLWYASVPDIPMVNLALTAFFPINSDENKTVAKLRYNLMVSVRDFFDFQKSDWEVLKTKQYYIGDPDRCY